MPIQLIWGNDLAASDRAIESLINQIIDPSWNSINLSRLDGSDINQTKRALEEACTPPFGIGGRIVLLKRSPICNNCTSEISEIFEKMITLIPQNTFLILNNVNKPDKRLKSTKKLESLIKSNQAIEKSFLLPAAWDYNGQKLFIEKTAKELHLNVTQDGISCLIDAIGNDSERLNSELIKLSIFVDAKNENKVITSDDIKKLIEGKTTNSLVIGNKLINKNLGEVIMLIDALLDTGEPPLRILATLTGQVRGCLWVSLLEKEGEKDVQKIAKAAGIGNPKRIYVIRKQIQGKSSDEFLGLLNQLLSIEAALKKGALAKNAFRDGLLTSNYH